MQNLATINQLSVNESLQSLYDKFIDFIEVSDKTKSVYARNIKQFLDFTNKNNIVQPTRETIRAFRQSLLDRELKPATIQAYITSLKVFFNFLECEYGYANITKGIKGAKLTREHKKDALTSNQVKLVLDKAKNNKRLYALLLLMFTAGLRTIEVSRATIKDLSVKGDNQVLYVLGKGKQEKEAINIDLVTYKAISEYLATRTDTDADAPLFTSTSNNSKGKNLTTYSISKMIKEAFKQAGIINNANIDRLTAHSTRHTAVTLSLLAGESLENVQKFARHQNLATTMIYNHAIQASNNTCSKSIAKMIFN